MRGIRRLSMRRRLLLALVALTGFRLALAESPAEPHVAVVTPVFTQLVMFSLPPEFKSPKATYEKNSGSFYIREQVPDGETRGKW